MRPNEASLARRAMLDGQLRPNRVTDTALLDAFGTLPRERFVPEAHAARAYADQDVPIAPGRALPAPMPFGRLLELAQPRHGERALVVGAGTGYGAAILAHAGLVVTATEADAALAQRAHTNLGALGLAVTWSPTWEAAAGPFDIIVVEGEVPEVPEALTARLVAGGRLVAGRGGPGRARRAVIARRAGGAVTLVEAFDCALPPLPEFAPAPAFVF